MSKSGFVYIALSADNIVGRHVSILCILISPFLARPSEGGPQGQKHHLCSIPARLHVRELHGQRVTWCVMGNSWGGSSFVSCIRRTVLPSSELRLQSDPMPGSRLRAMGGAAQASRRAAQEGKEALAGFHGILLPGGVFSPSARV